MKKVAAIDIGTNSMRLLLCEVSEHKLMNKAKEVVSTRIGRNVAGSRKLSDEAVARNIEVLKYFVNKGKEYGAEDIAAIATSAVRDAENREEFLRLAKKEASIDIKLIEGLEEAELGLIGAISESENKDDNVLVVDIGGGSTELILGNKDNIYYSTSINAGAVRMTESFIKSDPVSDNEMKALGESIKDLFNDAVRQLKNINIDRMIAIGGTATTLAAMYHELRTYKSDIVHNSVLNIEYLEKCFEKIKNMRIVERYDIAGLQKERADIIAAGLYILIFLMQSLEKSEVIISENDNLEGAVFKYLESKHA